MDHRGNHKFEYGGYDWRKSGVVTANDDVSGWHNRGFRLLSVSLSCLIGRTFYK
jgi:hypothetical protein